MKTRFDHKPGSVSYVPAALSSAAALLALISLLLACTESFDVNNTQKLSSEELNDRVSTRQARHLPSFPTDPSAFAEEITNPYLAFKIGKVFQYESETDDGIETVTVEVTNEKKMILGVATTVVHAQEFLDGELIEDTFDWFAQDEDGNVWYFGEDSKELEDGEVVSTEGSWEAGVNGAMPGIIMLANPKNGMKYQQEFAPGIAEDMAIIVNTNKTVEIGLGVFDGCLTTMEFNPLEPGHREHKYYYPGTGLILEGDNVELVSVSQ
jgi:hypothetical protein